MLVAVIPARFASKRFAGKAVTSISGQPLVARVAAAVVNCGVADTVIVATDDDRIVAAVASTGAEISVNGTTTFRSGSDRVAATVADRVTDQDVVIDVQGDEALVDADVLRAAARALAGRDIGTVAVPVGDGDIDDPDVVKVVIDDDGRARRFSRRIEDHGERASCWAHVGVYAYTGRTLRRFAELPTSDGEREEHLEQLRAMDAGMAIGVTTMSRPMPSVNRPSDVQRVEDCLLARQTNRS